MTLPARVQAFAVRHGLWQASTPVVAAVSGGADSVALLLILHELAQAGHLRLASVAHLHHRIRGHEADEDAVFVERLARRLAVPFELGHEDVPARAARTGESMEVAGRHARLAFFERLHQTGSVMALAHTRTDQAETVLLRLVRGAGPRGLGAMAPRSGHRVRPLLETPREDLRAWLTARGEAWREDSTNDDVTIARNRVRRMVMPQLSAINPASEAALARAAHILAADADLLDRLAEVEAGRLLRTKGGAVCWSPRQLAQLPEALARRVVRRAFLAVVPHRTPGWAETEAVLRSSAPRMDVGVARLELFGDSAVLSRRGLGATGPVADNPPEDTQTLTVPGLARHPKGWWTLEATGPVSPTDAGWCADVPAARTAYPDETRAVVDAAALGRHLTVRGWRPGDRVHPLGLSGRKKVQDVFVDRKVPRDERPFVPLVLDASGRIAWVAGHVVAEPFRVTPRSEAVVVLTLRH